jgi:hypothetical protein
MMWLNIHYRHNNIPPVDSIQISLFEFIYFLFLKYPF